MDSQLLPLEGMRSDLFDKIYNKLAEEDAAYLNGQSPEWWKALAKQSQTEGMAGIIESARDQLEQKGVNRMIGGIILKSIYVGWRMAELYLSEQLEKSAN